MFDATESGWSGPGMMEPLFPPPTPLAPEPLASMEESIEMSVPAEAPAPRKPRKKKATKAKKKVKGKTKGKKAKGKKGKKGKKKKKKGKKR